MSKTLTAFIVDRTSLDDSQLTRVNNYLERIILDRVFWARKTHQIAVAVGDGSGECTMLIPFTPVSDDTWENWQRIEPIQGRDSTAYDDIMALVAGLRAHVKKLKFTKRIVWFGGKVLPELSGIMKSLGDADIQFTAVIPEAESEPYQDLDDFCTEYDYKEVGAVGFYDGPLTLGHPNSDGFLELAVKCFPFCRKSSPPTSHAVYDNGTKIEQVSMARDKQVDDTAIDADNLSKGYNYGSEIITIPQQLDEQIRTGLGTSNDTGFEIIAFVPFKSPEIFTGESSVVCATDTQSQYQLGTIVHELFYAENVALARFSKRSKTINTQMVYLEPFIMPGEPERLLMTQVPFSEDWKRLVFTDLAKPAKQCIPGDELIKEMDAAVDGIDIQAHDYDIRDFIVPNPQVDRVLSYLRDEYADRPAQIKQLRLPISLLEKTVSLEKALDLQKTFKTKIVRDQEDLVAEEQELDLDELL